MVKNGKSKIRISTIIWICLILIIGISFLFIYRNFNPAESALMPQCVFYKLTGYKCVGCGFQRAAYAILNGNFAEAFRMNAFLVIGIPLILIYALADFTRNKIPAFYNFMNSKIMLSTVIVLIFAWWIGRNIIGI